MSNQTYTITFGDQAENHVGMQKLGTPLSKGFSHEDLIEIRKKFDDKGCETELIDLSSLLPHDVKSPAAHVLVISCWTLYIMR